MFWGARFLKDLMSAAAPVRRKRIGKDELADLKAGLASIEEKLKGAIAIESTASPLAAAVGDAVSALPSLHKYDFALPDVKFVIILVCLSSFATFPRTGESSSSILVCAGFLERLYIVLPSFSMAFFL
jgi:hypothetical protein